MISFFFVCTGGTTDGTESLEISLSHKFPYWDYSHYEKGCNITHRFSQTKFLFKFSWRNVFHAQLISTGIDYEPRDTRNKVLFCDVRGYGSLRFGPFQALFIFRGRVVYFMVTALRRPETSSCLMRKYRKYTKLNSKFCAAMGWIEFAKCREVESRDLCD